MRRVLLCVLTALLLATMTTPAQANSAGQQLHTFTDPNAKGLVARAIRLQQAGGSPKPLLASFEHWYPDSSANVPYLIKRSTDDGQTWTTIASVDDGEVGGDHPWKTKWTPTLLELPTAVGGFPAGTILMVAAVTHEAQGKSQLQLWRSTDHGFTWTYGGVVRSSVPGNVVWEPFLYLAGDGRVVVQYADDTIGGDQTITQVTSTNAGTTWSAPTNVVAAAGHRPGMPSTTKLPDGRYMVAYELCPINFCEVRVRTSADGLNWGTASNLGTRPLSLDGRYVNSGAYITWAPGGGPNGQLMLTGSFTRTWVTNGETYETTQTILVSYDLGVTWRRMPAPMKPEPLGGQCTSGNGLNWWMTLLPSDDGTKLRTFSPAGRPGSTQCGVWTAQANVGTLPYSANFGDGTDSGWIRYGGSWSAASGKLVESGGGVNGPKAFAGSTGWTNYTASAEISQNTAGGDAGLIVRGHEQNTGTDGHRGYYAGIAVNGNLFIGRQNYDYTSLGSVPIPAGIAAGTTYRLTVRAVGNQLTANVYPLGSTTALATLTVTDSTFPAGQVGVRNLNTSASFDNVTVNAS